MAKYKHISHSRKMMATIFGAAILVVGMTVWMVYTNGVSSRSKFVHENGGHIVINTVGATQDFVDALLAEKSGCDGYNKSDKNITYIVRQVDEFALVQYGCALDANMFYKKVDGEWNGISPTNQFVHNIPLCSHLKKHKIPEKIQSFCQPAPKGQGNELPDVTVNPVQG